MYYYPIIHMKGEKKTKETKTREARVKIVLEGLEDYKRDIGIAKQEMTDFLFRVRELNDELEQLNKHLEIFAELRKKLF